MPISVSKHAKKIRGCSIKLISSNEPLCDVVASATSSSLRLKSRKEGKHIFSAGFFSFKPLNEPEICNQKSNVVNKGLSPESNSKKQTDQLPFVPIPFIPPNPLLPPPSILPPNPLLPPPSLIPPVLPTPPPSIFPPFLPTPPTPPFFPLPHIPGLVPSPPPPAPTFPIPLPPFPFQPTPGFPGVPPAEVSSESRTISPWSCSYIYLCIIIYKYVI